MDADLGKPKSLGVEMPDRPSAGLVRVLICFLISCGLAVRSPAAHGADNEIKEYQLPAAPGVHDAVSYYYRLPQNAGRGAGQPTGVLMLVPGYNGSGLDFLKASSSWYALADSERLILVSPTFQTTLEEIHSQRGYYYASLWSGQATIDAVDHIAAQAGLAPGPLLIFGFSAGAHFAHRFALWNPARVKAFVAYAAAWWDAPTARLAGVPALIMCGEGDARYEPSHAFFEQGLALGLPWMWRSYPDTDHQITPPVTRMAQAFLGYYAAQRPQEHWIGDAQTYHFYAAGAEDVQFIPDEAKIEIPSRALAVIWSKDR